MRVVVMDDRCQGHGVCNMHAPEVFELGDLDGHAFVTADPVPEHLAASARRAAANCPEMAITVVED